MMPFNYYSNQYACAPTLHGKVVNDFREIVVGDIPTDGSQAFFIKSDLSEIQTRAWASDGRVVSCVFRPFNPAVNNLPIEPKQEEIEVQNASTEALEKRIEALEEQIAKLTPKRTTKNEA